MADIETAIGGTGREFQSTVQSLGIFPADTTPEDRKRRLADLARVYWKPIYRYIRARWKRSNEDAKDLTQHLFLWMIETDFLMKVRAERGRFRNFLKKAIERFVLGVHESSNRLKRGGGRVHVSLEDLDEKGAEPAMPSPESDALLDREWKRALVEEALRLLREECVAKGKEAHVRLFEEFHFSPGASPSYRELAERHDLSQVAVANILARTRSTFRFILMKLVAGSVSGPDELRLEFQDLFGKQGDTE